MPAATTFLFWPLCGLKKQFPTFCVFVLRGVEKKTHKHSVVGTNRKAWRKWADLGVLGRWGRQGVENVYEKYM